MNSPYVNSLYSVPGKVFLLGEYAVLAGLPGLIATLEPRFTLTSSTKAGKVGKVELGVPVVAPQSPMGRLLTAFPTLRAGLSFQDPYGGAGGFGASTAQFAMAYLALARQRGDNSARWLDAWRLYRDLMQDEPVVPSGADLVAQWEGGFLFFDPPTKNDPGHVMDLWALFDWSSLLVFSATVQAGRKVPTHRHLDQLAKEGFPDSGVYSGLASAFEKILIQGISAIQESRAGDFGEAMNQYAAVLQRAGLEISATTEDRKALGSLPGVLGVKGSGALQSDSILVLMKPDRRNGHPERTQVIEVAQSRGLRLMSDGLTCQMGITCQNQENQLSSNVSSND